MPDGSQCNTPPRSAFQEQTRRGFGTWRGAVNLNFVRSSRLFMTAQAFRALSRRIQPMRVGKSAFSARPAFQKTAYQAI